MTAFVWIGFVAVAGVQLVYWVFLAVKLLSYRYHPSDEDLSGVSVIVCARNEEANLRALLPRLYAQQYPTYEIVVINDRSDDGTYDYLQEQTSTQDILKVVEVTRTPGHVDPKKYALTLGIKVARYDHLIFTDADCLPATDEWLATMAGGFGQHTDFVLGYSQFIAEKGWVNAFSRFETQMTGMLCHAFALAGNPYMGVGRNMGYRKSYFLEKNGFSGYQQVTGGDDDLWVNRHATGSRTQVVLGEKALVWSHSKRTLVDFVRQKIRHISVSKYYRTKDKMLLGMYSVTHLLFWIAFIILALLNYFPEITFGVLGVRLLFTSFIVYATSKKLGERMVIWQVPVMDFLYGVYLLGIGIATFSTKKVKWN